MNTDSDNRQRMNRKRSAPLKQVPPAALKSAVRLLGILADENRLRIVLTLAQAGEMHVSALCELLEKQQPAVSHHLNLLRRSRVLSFRRCGKHNYYRLDTAHLEKWLEKTFTDLGNSGLAVNFENFALQFRRT